MQQHEISSKIKINSMESGLDTTSFLLVLILGFLLPIFFLPVISIPVNVSKSILISIFVIVAFFLWLIARLKDGRLVFPKSIILATAASLPIALFLSSIFSAAPEVSFMGLGYEIGTFSSILTLYILMFLSSIFFQPKKRVHKLYSAFFFSSLVIFSYQVIRAISLSFGLPFSGIFSGLSDNLIGKWMDLSIFFGFITVLLLTKLELFSFNKKSKAFLYTLLGISLLVLIFINSQLTWFILGIFSLIIFVYAISFGGEKIYITNGRKIPVVSLSVLVISLFFILTGGLIGDTLYSFSNISQEVLRPSWTQTFEIAKDALLENPILGAGPNKFVNQWLLFKPDTVNNSIIWNIDFNAGVGLIPSFIAETGIIGIIAWILFLGTFLYNGVRYVFLANVNKVNQYATFSSLLAAFYLWTFCIFYVPNITILFLAFLMTGIFIASLSEVRFIKNYNFSFLTDPRVGFVSVLVLILFTLASISWGYTLFQKFISMVYFQKSVVALNLDGDLDRAEQNMLRAIKLNKSDLYYRNLSEMNFVRLRNILSQTEVSEETIRAQFQSVSQAAVKNAITATEINPTNYLNFVSLARVYGSLLSFGAPKEFYDSAQQNYEKARTLNPKSPAVILEQARLEISVGNIEKAKEYIAEALNQKNNYTAAIFLLSQIQANEGNLDDAIVSAEVASMVSPNDIGVFFQLGFLRYKNNNYKGAIAAFERAIELNPNYSNAKYFLGLSYEEIREYKKALMQFEEISILNPDNDEVKSILKNLNAGRSPFANVTAPEDRKDLPIKE